MALSLDDIDKELAARQETGGTALSEIDAELERRGVKTGPSNVGLYNAGQTITNMMQPLANAQARLEATAPLAAGLITPGLGLAVDATQKGMKGIFEGFQKGGELATDVMTEKGFSPGASAAAGTGIGMIPQVASAFLPGPKMGEVRVLKPTPGPGRAAAVEAATEAGVPLTRAEITGSKPVSLLESGLEKTLTGSGQIQKFRQAQSAAIQNALEGIKKRFGSQEPLSSAGAESKLGMQSELGQARELGRKLYKDIPDVNIPPTNLRKTLNDISYANPEKRVLSVVNEVKQRVGFEGSQNANFQKLNDIRNYLSKEIQAETTFNPITGSQITETGRSLIPIKKALDEDIQNYISSSKKSEYGKMEANQFETAFTKANAFHGNVKDLINNKLVRKLSKAPESDVVKTVFGPGRPEDVLVAKAAMGQEGYQALKKQYFNDLIESKNIGNTLDKLEPEFLNTAFSTQEIEALRKLDAIKKISLGAEKLAGNPSGTAQNIGTGVTLAGLGHAGFKLLTSPLAAIAEIAAILGIPYVAAKAYIGSAKGIPLPVNTAAKVAIKGGIASQGFNVLGDKPSSKEVLTKVLNRIRGNQ